MNETANIIPMQAAYTEAQYRKDRAALEKAYGRNKKHAGVRYEQELAKLFDRAVPHLTQEQLAQIEGKTRQSIAYSLRFGKFLNWLNATVVAIPENFHFQLSEGKFRGFWEETNKADKELQRFRAVLELIGTNTVIKPNKASRQAYIEKLLKQFGRDVFTLGIPGVKRNPLGQSVRIPQRAFSNSSHNRLMPQPPGLIIGGVGNTQ